MAEKPMTGLEKAAVLLKSLSPAIVEKVLAHLDPKQAKLLTAEIAKVAQLPQQKELMARVLDEAVNVLSEDKQGHPGQPSAPSVGKAAKPDKGPSQIDVRIDGNAPKNAAEDADPIGAITALSPDLLTKALDTESARTISLLMNRMDVEAAGQIYKRLSTAKRKEVSLRFTDASTVSDDLLRHIASAVLKKCQTLRNASSTTNEQGDREKRMAGLLRSLERTERIETLTALEESDAELAARIKAMLYLFEDILRLENTSIQKLLSEIDMKNLSAALFGATPEIQERILTNLSRRAQESLKEEIELTGKVPSAKVKQARQSLEEAMQRLDQRGDFVMME